MPSHVILALLLALASTFPDETIRRYGGIDKTWELVRLNGDATNAGTTLTFPERGTIAGIGPCNSYSSTNTTPYPWFEIGPIAATKRACPDLATEAAFFDALRATKIAIIEDDTLTLSTDDRDLLVFKARD